jgi:hypothetical protein
VLDPSTDEFARALLLAVLGGSELRVFVDPAWREFVEKEDAPYIEQLLPDLGFRANCEPEATFSHLLTLTTGKLVVAESVDDISHRPDLLQIAAKFVAV